VTSLPRSTPAEQGVDPAGIEAMVAALAPLSEVELHSLMVVRHGHVVAEGWWEPYRREDPHLLYSLSKSFTSTAIGLAVAEGLVDLDATVLSYFPEFDARVTGERSRSMRVRDIAAMASGHEAETFERAYVAGDGDMVLGLLLTPPEREPGTIFAYNQPCTYTLGAIIARVSGVSLTEYLRPRLFEPLGISPYGWQLDQLGREQGFAGLHVPTEAIAKLGLLYLNHGEWHGRQLLTPEWVAEATRSHIPTNEPNPDWSGGYGFQFWQSRHGYRGDGAFGQFMLVLPEADAVVAMTAQSPDMQAMLNAVWTHLLPAMTDPAQPGGSWPSSPLSLPRPVPEGPAGEFVPATFRPGPGNDLETVSTVELRAGEIVLTDPGPRLTVALGAPQAWTRTGAVVSAYAWKEGLLLVDLVFAETPHRLHLTLDPVAGEFAARWQAAPLGRLPLAWMHSPEVKPGP
jgi:CubicO group peptidase (beta-lactamase class C family)